MSFNDLSNEVIQNIVRDCDGWTIFGFEKFVSAGVPPEMLKPLVQTFKSNLASPKSTIFTDTGVVSELTGVYGLDILQRVARDIGADTTMADGLNGRGFRAMASH